MKKIFFINVLKLKNHILMIVLLLMSVVVNASPPLASQQQIGMFKNSKTCIVLEEGSISFNVYIKEAVQKYWKITSYEFINQSEFEKRRHDSKYSFLILMKGVYDKDPGGVSYNFLSLVLGDSAWDMTNMPELCSIPIAYSDDISMSYGYAIPSIVKFMQIHTKNLETKRFILSIEGFKHYNSSRGFKDKALLLNKDMMASDANSIEVIRTVYPNYVKLISTIEIEKELSTNPKNILFNFHVGPTPNSGAGKCFEMIFDIEGNLYYYNSRKITNVNEDGFNLHDFSQIR